jgi:hypothetical protein
MGTRSRAGVHGSFCSPAAPPRTDIVSITPGAVGCIARLGVSLQKSEESPDIAARISPAKKSRRIQRTLQLLLVISHAA